MPPSFPRVALDASWKSVGRRSIVGSAIYRIVRRGNNIREGKRALRATATTTGAVLTHGGESWSAAPLGEGGGGFPIVGVARVADRKRRLCSSHVLPLLLPPPSLYYLPFCCHPRPQHGHRPRGLGIASPRTWHRRRRRQSVITDRGEGGVQFYQNNQIREFSTSLDF